MRCQDIFFSFGVYLKASGIKKDHESAGWAPFPECSLGSCVSTHITKPWVWAGFLAPWGSLAQPSTLQRCLRWLWTHKFSLQKEESPAAIAQLMCHTKDQQHFLRQQVLRRRMPMVLIPSYWCLVCCNFSEMGPYSLLYQELCSTIQISPWS